jgi:putative heme-binding domain-containing protein
MIMSFRLLRAALCITCAIYPYSHGAAAIPPRRAYEDAATRRDGSVSRGKAIFENELKAACAKCHSVDGSSGRAGPDLFAIGDKFPRRELVRSILEPSAAIAVGYATTTIETRSGEQHDGVVKQVTDAWVELMGADGRRQRVATADIATQGTSAISLMPEELHAGLSVEEFSDLIAYLTSLKQPDNALTSNRGMPAVIPELEKPVVLRPFFGEELRFPHAFVHKPGDVRSGLVWFGQIPGLSNNFLAVHQTGKVWLLDKNREQKSLFGDFAAELFNERGPNGLLGLAFHPTFRDNHKYYVKHQVMEEGKITTVLAEKIAAPDHRRDSGEPSRRLLKIVSVTQDHSGGCIEFGPDGYLYLAMGDTGPQQDPNGHGQDMQLFLAKILRIDVDRRDDGLPYATPPDNPFVGRTDARPEIWALGFREPWRFTFDALTGDLWVGDVGQDRVEEVAIVRRGENHGWNVYEGFEPFSNRYRKEGANYVAPIFGYRRKYGNSVTGGYVYRGDKNSSFYGVYVCGDYTSKRIWGVTQENRKLKSVWEIGTSPQFIASFGTDEQGNIYVVGYEGMVYQIDFEAGAFPSSSSARFETKAAHSQ